MNNEAISPFESSTKLMILLMVAAYFFSIAIRMIWVYQMGDVPIYHWNGQLMINTNDGYIWASGAQKVLEGMHQYNPRVPDWLSYGVVFFTVIAAKILPFTLDTIILYMPAAVAGLVVIPIILIGRLFNFTFVSFLAALIGSVAWSYYNRTMIGYYDTDMFSAMAPMFILYFLLRTIEYENLNNTLISALIIFAYPFLYDGGLSLVYAMALLYMLYMVIFHRKEAFTYQSITLISVALMGMPWLVKLLLIIILYLAFMRVAFNQKKLIIASAIAVLLFLYSGNVFALLWAKFSVYFFRGVDESGGLKFYEVAQTVREAGRIPFETMANRISGSIPGVIAALLGYLLLVIRHRSFILALPLIGIGIFSLWGGLRFTVFAVPVAAISAVYLFYVLASYIKPVPGRYGVLVLLWAAMLYPNITHIIGYKVPTVFNDREVKILNTLKAKGSSKDYVVTWWDYGYPIWYYGEKNTLVDGGKHNHDNFIVSEILTTPSQLEAARLSRIAVETYVESNYSIIADTLFKNGRDDQVDVAAYLENLRYGDAEMPKKTREVYLYLPWRMMDIFPTVKIFSNIDLQSGKKYNRPFFYMSRGHRDTPENLNLGSGVLLDKKSGMLQVGRQKVPLKYFYTVGNRSDGTVSVKQQLVRAQGRLSIIFLASYNRFLVVDDNYLNSTFIKMFVFEQYDKKLFEQVITSPYAKIYRVKI
jgi:dolichyl-diphosphooligosaccharide--protein glycosyltransferase/undecaprenyl-diphosphooligosaccharide--protein glycosyltransferase